jgi:hypothetical protein
MQRKVEKVAWWVGACCCLLRHFRATTKKKLGWGGREGLESDV